MDHLKKWVAQCVTQMYDLKTPIDPTTITAQTREERAAGHPVPKGGQCQICRATLQAEVFVSVPLDAKFSGGYVDLWVCADPKACAERVEASTFQRAVQSPLGPTDRRPHLMMMPAIRVPICHPEKEKPNEQ